MRGKTSKIMRAGLAACLALGGAMAGGGSALAKKTNFSAAHGYYAKAYGKALPPIGFVNFCARHPADCRPIPMRVKKLRLDPARWDLLLQVNSFVNRKIAPVTDQELYNQPEVWEYPRTAGDCEDYVLLKKRYLEGLGFPAETLLITVVLDEKGGGHAVLMVRTDSGDFILDNRRDRVLPWFKTGYRYIKRQSQAHPGKWVSLSTRGARARYFGNN